MNMIQVSEFKAKCLALVESVARTGETLVVTKNGKPIAELKPYSGGRSLSPFGLHRKLQIIGNVIDPVAENDWKVLE